MHAGCCSLVKKGYCNVLKCADEGVMCGYSKEMGSGWDTLWKGLLLASLLRNLAFLFRFKASVRLHDPAFHS